MRYSARTGNLIVGREPFPLDDRATRRDRALLVLSREGDRPHFAFNLTTADIADSAGAQIILDAIRRRWPWIKHLFADGAYDRRKLMDKAAFEDFVIEIVRRIDSEPGFNVLPRRWVVERTFAWMTRWRRLVRNYERRIDVSKAMIHVALGSLLLRRIAH
jgi:transposase